MIQLAPLDRSDAVTVRQWRNDYEIWRWCRQNDFISDVEQEAWFDRQSKDPSIRMYKIVVIDGEKPFFVGVAGFTSIDLLNRRAEFSLYISPKLQRNGLGRGALSCLLTHGFKNLGLWVIYGETFDGNPAARMFEAMGFVKEGTRRDFYFRDGRLIDAHLYSMRASEWI